MGRIFDDINKTAAKSRSAGKVQEQRTPAASKAGGGRAEFSGLGPATEGMVRAARKQRTAAPSTKSPAVAGEETSKVLARNAEALATMDEDERRRRAADLDGPAATEAIEIANPGSGAGTATFVVRASAALVVRLERARQDLGLRSRNETVLSLLEIGLEAKVRVRPL